MIAQEVTSRLEWQFPGGAWGLAAAGAAALLVIALSYRFSLVDAPPWARLALGVLRAAMAGVLLFCLARPTAVEEQSISPDQQRSKVAVLIDESGSMQARGNSGRSRLDEAMLYWHNTLAPLKDRFDLESMAFAEQVRPLEKVASEAFRPPAGPPLQTHLFTSLAVLAERLTAEKFDGVICLTDGLDTSDQPRQRCLGTLPDPPCLRAADAAAGVGAAGGDHQARGRLDRQDRRQDARQHVGAVGGGR